MDALFDKDLIFECADAILAKLSEFSGAHNLSAAGCYVAMKAATAMVAESLPSALAELVDQQVLVSMKPLDEQERLCSTCRWGATSNEPCDTCTNHSSWLTNVDSD